MELDWTLAGGLVVTAALVSLASLVAMSAMALRFPPSPASVFAGPTPSTVLLFDGEHLLDATPPARAMIETGVETGGPWFRALSRLEPVFPGVTLRLDGLGQEGRFVLPSREGVVPPLILRAEHLGGLTRLTLVESDQPAVQSAGDTRVELMLQAELAVLREVVDRAPLPLWRSDAGGAVIWANAAYLRHATELLEPGQDIGWPLPEILPGAEGRRAIRRAEDPHWFEVTTQSTGADVLHYALPATRLVQAETSLRDFMQTLTKTFAQLPIGLAIFDRNRVLQMFNPALIDLSGVAAEVLIARPTLSLLLDAMREQQRIPEPKDYRSWRRRIVEMEEAAASGLFEDTWTLPGGQTYRVTGRPHPNGALAFMLEDISTEITRTRRYRAELELGQAVIDAMEEAVVVLAQDGGVVLTNATARHLWGEALFTAFSDRVGPPALELWRQMTAPTLLWDDLATYIGRYGVRDPWQGEVRLTDGRLLDCRILPMPQGSTLVSFRLSVDIAPAAQADGQAIMIA